MKIEKLSLQSIKNALSREELKKIMAGSGPCVPAGQGLCTYADPTCCEGSSCNYLTGTCEFNT